MVARLKLKGIDGKAHQEPEISARARQKGTAPSPFAVTSTRQGEVEATAKAEGALRPTLHRRNIRHWNTQHAVASVSPMWETPGPDAQSEVAVGFGGFHESLERSPDWDEPRHRDGRKRILTCPASPPEGGAVMASPVHEGMVRGAVAHDKNDGDRTRLKLTRDPLLAALQVEAKLCNERRRDVQKPETASLPETLRAEFFRDRLDTPHTFRDGHPRRSSCEGSDGQS